MDCVLPQQLLTAGPALPTVLCASGLLLLVPSLRRVTFDVLETIIASFLLLVLVTVVLGLPFAATYIGYKGVLFALRSVTGSLPHLQDALSLTQQAITQHV